MNDPHDWEPSLSAAEHAKSPTDPVAEPRGRLLLASREAATRRWGERWLRVAGYDVVLATTAEEVPRRVAEGRPDVVLVDAGLLADADGFGDGSSAITGGERVPIVALCAGRKEIRQALDEGATDVVVSPIQWELVSRRCGLLVELRRRSTELDAVRVRLGEALGQVAAARGRMQELLSCDPLTGLPNRDTFTKMLDRALLSTRADARVAVLLVDVDRFKSLNEVLGRRAGDEIVIGVAERLAQNLRSDDMLTLAGPGVSTSVLARLVGDEFAIMVTNVHGLDDARALARHALQGLRGPLRVGGREVVVSVSIGVACFPWHGRSAEVLLQHGELALGKAKRKGGGVACCYRDALSAGSERKLELTALMHEALEREQFHLCYQPLVDARGRIVGAEALLRWHHAQLGPISPEEFVPVAEESGLMSRIGTWVLETACAQLRSWLDAGLAPLRLSVNVSLCQLTRGDLPQIVRRVLDEHGLEGSLLELELSERGALRSDDEILLQLREIKKLGVRLSVDDFGTGDSAIAYLKRFPFDTLKIDRSWVSGVNSDDEDAALTAATIAMACRLHLDVVAEGVENAPQLEFLRECGCGEYQGFLFSPAVSPEEFVEMARTSPFDRLVEPLDDDDGT